MRNRISAITVVLVFIAAFPLQAMAQEPGYTPPPPPPPPSSQQAGPPPSPPPVASAQLDQLVSRIALYPDSLLAQILTAATFPDQIPDAAQWAREHAGLHGNALANAIREDNVQWDPSVIALVPFPSVLDMMAKDMNWTQQLVMLSSRSAAT